MLFAAGLGTRLRPYTNDRPKAMVKINGMPLLEIVLRRLKYFGVEEVVVNVHHYAQQIIDFLALKNNFGLTIHISHEKKIVLETGGGLKKARHFFQNNEPFLVHNVDVISDLNLREIYQFHLKNDALSTLAVRERESSRKLLFSKENKQLIGWQNMRTGEQKISRKSLIYNNLAFSGIHVISPRIFNFMPKYKRKFSIIDTYLEAAKTDTILGFPHTYSHWLDVGKIPALAEAQKLLPQIQLAE